MSVIKKFITSQFRAYFLFGLVGLLTLASNPSVSWAEGGDGAEQEVQLLKQKLDAIQEDIIDVRALAYSVYERTYFPGTYGVGVVDQDKLSTDRADLVSKLSAAKIKLLEILIIPAHTTPTKDQMEQFLDKKAKLISFYYTEAVVLSKIDKKRGETIDQDYVSAYDLPLPYNIVQELAGKTKLSINDVDSPVVVRPVSELPAVVPPDHPFKMSMSPMQIKIIDEMVLKQTSDPQAYFTLARYLMANWFYERLNDVNDYMDTKKTAADYPTISSSLKSSFQGYNHLQNKIDNYFVNKDETNFNLSIEETVPYAGERRIKALGGTNPGQALNAAQIAYIDELMTTAETFKMRFVTDAFLDELANIILPTAHHAEYKPKLRAQFKLAEAVDIREAVKKLLELEVLPNSTLPTPKLKEKLAYIYSFAKFTIVQSKLNNPQQFDDDTKKKIAELLVKRTNEMQKEISSSSMASWAIETERLYNEGMLNESKISFIKAVQKETIEEVQKIIDKHKDKIVGNTANLTNPENMSAPDMAAVAQSQENLRVFAELGRFLNTFDLGVITIKEGTFKLFLEEVKQKFIDIVAAKATRFNVQISAVNFGTYYKLFLSQAASNHKSLASLTGRLIKVSKEVVANDDKDPAEIDVDIKVLDTSLSIYYATHPIGTYGKTIKDNMAKKPTVATSFAYYVEQYNKIKAGITELEASLEARAEDRFAKVQLDGMKRLKVKWQEVGRLYYGLDFTSDNPLEVSWSGGLKLSQTGLDDDQKEAYKDALKKQLLGQNSLLLFLIDKDNEPPYKELAGFTWTDEFKSVAAKPLVASLLNGIFANIKERIEKTLAANSLNDLRVPIAYSPLMTLILNEYPAFIQFHKDLQKEVTAPSFFSLSFQEIKDRYVKLGFGVLLFHFVGNLIPAVRTNPLFRVLDKAVEPYLTFFTVTAMGMIFVDAGLQFSDNREKGRQLEELTDYMFTAVEGESFIDYFQVQEMKSELRWKWVFWGFERGMELFFFVGIPILKTPARRMLEFFRNRRWKFLFREVGFAKGNYSFNSAEVSTMARASIASIEGNQALSATVKQQMIARIQKAKDALLSKIHAYEDAWARMGRHYAYEFSQLKMQPGNWNPMAIAKGYQAEREAIAEQVATWQGLARGRIATAEAEVAAAVRRVETLAGETSAAAAPARRLAEQAVIDARAAVEAEKAFMTAGPKYLYQNISNLDRAYESLLKRLTTEANRVRAINWQPRTNNWRPDPMSSTPQIGTAPARPALPGPGTGNPRPNPGSNPGSTPGSTAGSTPLPAPELPPPSYGLLRHLMTTQGETITPADMRLLQRMFQGFMGKMPVALQSFAGRHGYGRLPRAYRESPWKAVDHMASFDPNLKPMTFPGKPVTTRVLGQDGQVVSESTAESTFTIFTRTIPYKPQQLSPRAIARWPRWIKDSLKESVVMTMKDWKAFLSGLGTRGHYQGAAQ